MNRTNRGPILFTLAGECLLFALLAYLVSDAEYNEARHVASLRQRQTLAQEYEQSIADGDELHRRQNIIIESLKRLQESAQQIEAIPSWVEKSKGDRDDQRIDNHEAHRERTELRRGQAVIKKILSDITETLKSAPAPKHNH